MTAHGQGFEGYAGREDPFFVTINTMTLVLKQTYVGTATNLDPHTYILPM